MAHWQSGNGRAQVGGAAQTWSDASCITSLTFAYCLSQFVVVFVVVLLFVLSRSQIGWHTGRGTAAQVGGVAQTWSDASCITLSQGL